MRKAVTIVLFFALWLSCGAFSPQDDTPWMAGKDKVELEQAFWDDLMVYRPKGKSIRPDDLRRIDKNLYVNEGGYYESESIQNTSFFRKSFLSWSPVCETTLPVESTMTLLTGHTGRKQYSVHFLQHRYGYGKAETDIPLALLLEYCLEMGCTPYVGIESQEGDIIEASLFMVNVDAGFCHTFRFKMDTVLFDHQEGEFDAEAFTFTPIYNIKK